MTDLSRPPEEDRPAFVAQPPAKKPACVHGCWVNVSPTPEAMPKMEFKCWATGWQGNPVRGRARGMCYKCVLYKEKK